MRGENFEILHSNFETKGVLGCGLLIKKRGVNLL